MRRDYKENPRYEIAVTFVLTQIVSKVAKSLLQACVDPIVVRLSCFCKPKTHRSLSEPTSNIDQDKTIKAVNSRTVIESIYISEPVIFIDYNSRSGSVEMKISITLVFNFM